MVVARVDTTVAFDVVAAIDVAAADDVVAAVGAATAVVVWVQRCWMRACTSLQSHLVSMVVTLRGKTLSWWYQKITQGPHLRMGRLVCCQPWC